MIRGGKGGAHTKTGLEFERGKDLKHALEAASGYSVKDDVVYFDGKKVAQFFKKNKLYTDLLEPRGVHVSKLISSKLLPDNALLVFRKHTLYIVELKFQGGSGSTDEKIQTCDFKLKQYQKLIRPLNLKVEYVYFLCDWFKHPRYRDVCNYIESVGCHYFFEEIPLLRFMGLPYAD